MDLSISMSGVTPNLRSWAQSMARQKYKEISKKKVIRNKGAYVSRFTQRIYVQALENQLNANDQHIRDQEEIIEQIKAEIEELKDIEIRYLGSLVFNYD